jgi:indole-3-glycerol phosphate synthase
MPTTSQTQRLKYQGQFLAEIMAHKREELPKLMREAPMADVRAAATVAPPPRDFAAALRPPDGPAGVRLIAEIKRASPSKGLLCRDFDPAVLAETYARSGAAAISVLTDARFFQGDLTHLARARQHLDALSGRTGGPPSRPLLRKDFIFDPYQIVAARAAGADAVLLIVAALSDRDLRQLLAETRRYRMEALVEVHSEAEVTRALAAGARVVGINNRDLRTFQVDLATTERLRPLVPPEVIVVTESGLHTPGDVQAMRDLRVDAMLVGEAFVKAPAGERAARVRELVEAGMPARPSTAGAA